MSIPDDAPPGQMIGIAVEAVMEQTGGNCATLEIKEDPAKWFQIMDCTINCHYPHNESPDLLYPELIRHPLVADLVGFEGETHMTVSLNEMDREGIVSWIEHYMTKVLSLDPATIRMELRMERI